MKLLVERHAIPHGDKTAYFLPKRVARIPERIDLAMQFVENLSRLTDDCIKLSQDASFVDPRPDLISRLLYLAAESGDCLFSVATEQQDGLTLDGRPVRWTGHPDESTVHTGRWLSTFYVNLICRRAIAIQRLVRVPPELLLASTTQLPTSQVQLASAYMAHWLGIDSEHVGQALLRAQRSTGRAQQGQLYILSHDVFQIQLFALYLDRDESEFQSWLVKGLEAHRDFWSEDEEHACEPQGYVSIPLTALAALAWDAGMRFDIDSEYLPMRLVTGEFLKDLPQAENGA